PECNSGTNLRSRAHPSVARGNYPNNITALSNPPAPECNSGSNLRSRAHQSAARDIYLNNITAHSNPL
ncbi:MAG: hypothetical protein WA952_06515, partial [Lewinella sp.]